MPTTSPEPLSIALADDTSASDKLRILYSTRFTFTDDGVPLITPVVPFSCSPVGKVLEVDQV